jgi:hypothetical protein
MRHGRRVSNSTMTGGGWSWYDSMRALPLLEYLKTLLQPFG